jgi:hypothetical protein
MRDLATAWHLLIARAMNAAPLELNGAELRNPWIHFRVEQIDGMQWLGATATSLAVHRIGRTDLADRLAGWALGSDRYGIMPGLFTEVLRLAGLPTAPVEVDDDIDALIDEVLAVADELDGIEPYPIPRETGQSSG